MAEAPTRTPVEVSLDKSGNAAIRSGHKTLDLDAADTDNARSQVITWVAKNVAKAGEPPVQVTVTDPSGTWHISVTAEGKASRSDHGKDRVAPVGQEASPLVDRDSKPRTSFITAGRTQRPAQQGWRGAINQVGLRLPPGEAEVQWRGDSAAVAQHWGGPRTVAIANGKGSANKTPTTACLSAVFARHGGAGVLAWDNNDTRGSLAWRTESAPHMANILDLLPRADALMASTAQYAEMAHHVHHQPEDRYDVLWSDQSVAGDHIVTADEVDQVHQIAARYYRLVIMDSGNSERASNWREMIQRSDRLVVPCTNVEDTAEAGARLIEALAARNDPHGAQLAKDAVVIVSQRTPGKDPNMGRIVQGFRDLDLDVVTIPYDPALQTGVIRYDSLRPATQRAWLRAAATVARGL